VLGVIIITAIAVALPPPSFAQPKPVPAAQTETTVLSVEQLDAMLAPIALYPDELLTQVLMASTYQLQVVAASRWLQGPSGIMTLSLIRTASCARRIWDQIGPRSSQSRSCSIRTLAGHGSTSWTERAANRRGTANHGR
jgi:Protein of unknown function (DUF3300)